MDEYRGELMDDLKRAYVFALAFWSAVIVTIAAGAGWLIWTLTR